MAKIYKPFRLEEEHVEFIQSYKGNNDTEKLENILTDFKNVLKILENKEQIIEIIEEKKTPVKAK